MLSEPSRQPEPAGGFEIVDHTADWALRVWGDNLTTLLMNAALGMSSLVVGELYDVPLNIERTLELEAFDAETLLVDWLGELAYIAEEEQLVFREFRLRDVTANYLAADLRGGRAPELQKHIKAVTYHNLAIEKIESGLTVTIVFDV
jgi:SHS2 domain-containing protein